MNFSAWAIRKPTPAILLFIIATAAGLVGFRQLGVQSVPDLEFPIVNIVATLPGATPSQLETEVVRPIEDSIATVGSIKHVTSTINDGGAVISLSFEFGKNMQEATTDVRDAITRIRTTLPSDLQEPQVTHVTYSGDPTLTYAVYATDMDEADLSWFVDNTITKTLLPITGVSQIQRQGGVKREVQVELDPVRLQALNLTAGEISTQLRASQQEASGGRGTLGGLEQTVRTIATVGDASQLGAVVIPLSDGRRLRLDEIATVHDTVAERRALALLDGRPVVSFVVLRAKGFDETRMADDVHTAVAQLMREHPRVRIEEVANSVDSIHRNYEASMHALYEGAILAVLVVWLFLRDWRATLVSAVALPLSVIPTFLVMALLGYTLNVITLLALTLVVGILVDDAIVEVENIMRHLREGKSPLQAAIGAADEIGLAVIATSFTLVAVFLPVGFVGGLTGDVFKQFGWTASVAILFSLLVARLLTPMMAAFLLKPHGEAQQDGGLMRRYLRAVRWCLQHPAITSLAAAAVFIGSMMLISTLPTSFLNAEDVSKFTVAVQAPPGSTLQQTAQLSEQARQVIMQMPEVAHVYAAVGIGATTGMQPTAATDVTSAQVLVRLKPANQRKRTQQQVQAALAAPLQKIPGARITVGIGASGEKLTFDLAGDDSALLDKTAFAVAAELRSIPQLGAISTSASLLRPELVIRPDFERAAQMGVTANAIGQAVRIATTGDYDFNLPRLNLPERQIYVRVKLDPRVLADPQMLSQLRVRGHGGTTVPLQGIADIRTEGGPSQIERFDRQRVVKISADLRGMALGDALKAAEALPAMRALPAGIHQVPTGESENMKSLFAGFLIAMVGGIFCVYAVMVLLFHDFGQPITVLTALPFAVCGALGMLVIFHYALSLASLIGLLMLIGIVTKNSILLVEYAIVARRDHGLNRLDALIDACSKRARPIVMTTVAMTAGMMPMAFGLEGDPGVRAPMAVVVIGGLFTSTVLSLLVVPVVFELVDEGKEFFLRIFRRFGAHQPESREVAAVARLDSPGH